MKTKELKNNWVILLIALLISNHTKAQNYIPQYLQNPDEFITNNTSIFDNSGWLTINKDVNISANDFIEKHKQSIGLGVDDELALVKVTTDNYPFTTAENQYKHYKFQQKYKGLDVQFAEFFLHEKDGYLRYLSLKVAENLTMNIQPVQNEAQALNSAINALGSANEYIWLDEEYEQDYKTETGNINATYYPIGKLMICYIGNAKDYSANNFKLAWKFTIESLKPVFTNEVYIDAITGALLKTNSLMCNGSANLLYYGNQQIITDWRSAPFWNYRLKAKIGGANIHTKWATYNSSGKLKNHNLVNNITDGDDNWGMSDAAATTPHWAAIQSHHYFWDNFAQSGIDNNWGELRVFANATHSQAQNNAYWRLGDFGSNNNNKDYITIGSHNGNHLCAIDIVGHEFAHGVTHSQGDLQYSYESGALNESFSDIFGCMVEKYAQGGSISDWNIGEDAWLLRRLNNPSNSPSIPQPSVLYGTNWYTGASDYGGVHINSGVQNYWFYLLSQGSVAAPDGTYNNYTVNGIGSDAASRIAYYNLSSQLNSNATYNDARNGSIWSSLFLYGNCSNEYKQTNNAWACVGIGLPIVQLTITGPSTIYHLANGDIMGSMPKNFIAVGDIPNYTWTSTEPWLYNINGTSNQNFSVSNFLNSFSTATLQLNGQCESTAKTINFYCVDCNFYNGNTGGVKLYPNPAKEQIHIEADFINHLSEEPIIVTISDVQGVYPLQQNYFYYLPESIDVSNYTLGTYYVLIQQGDKLAKTIFTKN